MPTAADFPQLGSAYLFHDLELETLGRLLADCGTRRLVPGEVLLEPGVPNQALYVILSGELRVYLSSRTLPHDAVLGVGDCAGELSLIDGKGATALVLAGEATDLLVIPDSILWAMVDQSNGIARNLLHIISRRMRNENLILRQAQSRSQEFEQAASMDSLTGLHNRRWLAEFFPRVLRRCVEDGQPLCLVMADVDHFKRYNDKHGHLAGDRILKAVADLLADSLRPENLIARYGGEEFALLLPNVDRGTAVGIAERLRKRVAAMTIQVAPAVPAEAVTISCGVAALRPGMDLETLIARADQALYRAKKNGRNRVEQADGPDEAGISGEPRPSGAESPPD
jgi:diguanylate cyclase (GGDEF)-like protein